MSTPFMKRLLTIAVALTLSLVVVGQARADLLVIPAGFDLFQTVPGSAPDMGTFVDASFPTGFFGMVGGTPSDPVMGRHFLMGLPTGPMGHMPTEFRPEPFNELSMLAQHGVLDVRDGGGLSSTDTIVMRGGLVLPMVGDMGTVPIEIVSLSLTSIQPLEVTYGAEPPSFFDVFVDLDPAVQQPGAMTLTRTHPNGGTFDSLLPVQFRVTFVNHDPNGPNAVDRPQILQLFESRNVPFSSVQVVPEPASLSLVLMGAFGVVAIARRRVQSPAK